SRGENSHRNIFYFQNHFVKFLHSGAFDWSRHTAAHKKTAAQPLLQAHRRFMAFTGCFSYNICAPLL
ncbi:hypothetical protein, partial [Hominenteromicrobium sp.]|uniref:hypothetical protein n=1 Tax=Hominenteromicrobium sp. TaxID=3073581 RepID=UPI003A8EAF61